LQEAWRMCALVQPERLVSHRFALEDAPAAYRLLDQQPAAALQVLLTY
jgi:threonine dehydrogenase-like Zn-dependent dehydrogenase